MGLETWGEKVEEGGEGNSQIKGFVREAWLPLGSAHRQGVRERDTKGPREPVSRHRAGGIDALVPRLPPPGLLQKRQEAPLPWTAAWEMRTSPLTITPLQQVRRDPPGHRGHF